ncbi:hypothetical protein TDIS_2161 [Thermosulfurimonas dismutans]|uniref:Uncharacterized protein n=1 Tax=Thermosulfurimonas dismutans TaxID=999894 RepID=A0A179D110_9BACT|nr:hypothetical protein TDIS_2161 [Thermosulfurimonas dismutans]
MSSLNGKEKFKFLVGFLSFVALGPFSIIPTLLGLYQVAKNEKKEKEPVIALPLFAVT